MSKFGGWRALWAEGTGVQQINHGAKIRETRRPQHARRRRPRSPHAEVSRKPAEGFTPLDPFPAATADVWGRSSGADRLGLCRAGDRDPHDPLSPQLPALARRGLSRPQLSRSRLPGFAAAAGLWAGRAAALPVGSKDRRRDLRFFRIFAAAVRLPRLDRQPVAVSSSGRPAVARHRAADGDRHLRRRLSAHPLFGRGQALRLRHAGDPAAAGVADRVAAGTRKRPAGSGPWPWLCRWPCCFPIRRCSSCRPSAWPC